VSITRRCAFLLAAAFAVVTVRAAGAPPSKREAAAFQQKIEKLKEHQPKRRTVVTENELAAYFQFDAAKDLPVGLVSPSIKVLGPNRLSGYVVADLDAVRKASPPKSLLDPKNLLLGRVPLSAIAVFTAKDGMGKFVLESAKLGNLPLPKLLLDEIASYYTRSESRPNGYTTEDPWPLPAGIREVRITPGQALIVQ
jgi:hypothetical protein